MVKGHDIPEVLNMCKDHKLTQNMSETLWDTRAENEQRNY